MVMKKKCSIIGAFTVLVLLLSLMLFTEVSAENGETEVKISYTNISLNEETQIFNIKYAVSVSDGIAERLGEVRMLNWASEDESGRYEASENDSATVGWQMIGGVKCAIFDFACDLSSLSDMAYARAYIDIDGTRYYSEVNKYNFIAYAYNKQNTEDIKTAEIIAAVKRLGDMLTAEKHGISAEALTPAQKLELRMPSAQWYRIRVKNAYLSDGFEWGMYLEGDKVSVASTKEGTLCHLTSRSGECIPQNSITVTASEDYTASYSLSAADTVTHSHSWSTGGKEAEAEITLPKNSALKADYLKNLWNEGYTHIVFTVASGADAVYSHGGTSSRYSAEISANQITDVRIDINEFHDGDVWYDLVLASEAELCVSSVRAYKSAETLSFTKSSTNSYFALEDGCYVFEAHENGASVISPSGWLDKYGLPDDKAGKALSVYTDYINKEENLHSMLWGFGSAVDYISQSADGGRYLLPLENAGESFSLHLEFSGSARFQILEVVSTAPNIRIANVDYEITTNIFIKYYVLSENMENTDGIKLLLWKSAPADKSYVQGTETDIIDKFTKEIIDGKEYLVFEYSECKYTDIVYPIYTRAISEAESLSSEVNKYSIFAYAYEKLGKINPEDKTDNNTLAEKLQKTINLAATMQSYLNIDTDRPINGAWYSVRVENGTLPDGFNEGIYFPGDSIVLTADTVRGKEFSHWELNGANVGSNETIEITVGEGHTVYTAVYQ